MTEESVITRRDRWWRALVVVWTIVGMILVLVAAGWLLARLAPAVRPLVIALIIVLSLRGPVHHLQGQGWPRAWAVGVIYLLSIALLVFTGLFIVPPVSAQIAEFVKAFPGYYRSAYSFGQDLLAQYKAVAPGWLERASQALYEAIPLQFSKLTARVAQSAFSAAGTLLGTVVDIFLALVIAFWLLKDLPAIREELLSVAGARRRDEVRVVSHQVSTVLGGYLRGMLLVCLVTGVLETLGLWLFHVPYPLVLGLLGGVLNVVPYVGPAVTAGIAAMVGGFVSPWLALAGIAVVFVAQEITDLFITPRVMSSQVDLHPALVITSLLVGAALFGFWGLVVAIPVAAAGKGLFVYYFEKYTRSTICSEDGAFFKLSEDGREGVCDAGEVAAEQAEAEVAAEGLLEDATRRAERIGRSAEEAEAETARREAADEDTPAPGQHGSPEA